MIANKKGIKTSMKMLNFVAQRIIFIHIHNTESILINEKKLFLMDYGLVFEVIKIYKPQA